MADLLEGIEVTGHETPSQSKILTPEALDFLALLHRQFNPRRLELLKRRERVKGAPHVLKETKAVREDASWKVAPRPKDLETRWVEITGPTDAKMVINALNSGADTFMADFEDANSPTWFNLIEGQNNLIQAVRKTIAFTNPDGKEYRLNDKIATLMVRPRGWHLPEKHLLIDNEEMSGSLFDFGLYFFHNAKELLKRGSGPYFYLPKMESHLEARLWNDVFVLAQDTLGIPHGSIRATVLIETIPAAFEMEEILYELREHMSGLNAGRWDYIFSIIKKLNTSFPDRGEITMTTPFMKAYTALLVKTCHKRGASALGGMAAFIPSRKDVEVNKVALAKVYEDKQREVSEGFDGTWVAHPDLVKTAREPFEKKAAAHTPSTHNPEFSQLLDFKVPDGQKTEKGFRQNVEVALKYLAAWFQGTGAVGIHNLMEDAATAEISRAQLWQWCHSHAKLDKGLTASTELFDKILKEEYDKAQNDSSYPEAYKKELPKAKKLFDSLVRNDHFEPFLTNQAYSMLE